MWEFLKRFGIRRMKTPRSAESLREDISCLVMQGNQDELIKLFDVIVDEWRKEYTEDNYPTHIFAIKTPFEQVMQTHFTHVWEELKHVTPRD